MSSFLQKIIKGASRPSSASPGQSSPASPAASPKPLGDSPEAPAGVRTGPTAASPNIFERPIAKPADDLHVQSKQLPKDAPTPPPPAVQPQPVRSPLNVAGAAPSPLYLVQPVVRPTPENANADSAAGTPFGLFGFETASSAASRTSSTPLSAQAPASVLANRNAIASFKVSLSRCLNVAQPADRELVFADLVGKFVQTFGHIPARELADTLYCLVPFAELLGVHVVAQLQPRTAPIQTAAAVAALQEELGAPTTPVGLTVEALRVLCGLADEAIIGQLAKQGVPQVLIGVLTLLIEHPGDRDAAAVDGLCALLDAVLWSPAGDARFAEALTVSALMRLVALPSASSREAAAAANATRFKIVAFRCLGRVLQSQFLASTRNLEQLCEAGHVSALVRAAERAATVTHDRSSGVLALASLLPLLEATSAARNWVLLQEFRTAGGYSALARVLTLSLSSDPLIDGLLVRAIAPSASSETPTVPALILLDRLYALGSVEWSSLLAAVQETPFQASNLALPALRPRAPLLTNAAALETLDSLFLAQASEIQAQALGSLAELVRGNPLGYYVVDQSQMLVRWIAALDRFDEGVQTGLLNVLAVGLLVCGLVPCRELATLYAVALEGTARPATTALVCRKLQGFLDQAPQRLHVVFRDTGLFAVVAGELRRKPPRGIADPDGFAAAMSLLAALLKSPTTCAEFRNTFYDELFALLALGAVRHAVLGVVQQAIVGASGVSPVTGKQAMGDLARLVQMLVQAAASGDGAAQRDLLLVIRDMLCASADLRRGFFDDACGGFAAVLAVFAHLLNDATVLQRVAQIVVLAVADEPANRARLLREPEGGAAMVVSGIVASGLLKTRAGAAASLGVVLGLAVDRSTVFDVFAFTHSADAPLPYTTVRSELAPVLGAPSTLVRASQFITGMVALLSRIAGLPSHAALVHAALVSLGELLHANSYNVVQMAASRALFDAVTTWLFGNGAGSGAMLLDVQVTNALVELAKRLLESTFSEADLRGLLVRFGGSSAAESAAARVLDLIEHGMAAGRTQPAFVRFDHNLCDVVALTVPEIAPRPFPPLNGYTFMAWVRIVQFDANSSTKLVSVTSDDDAVRMQLVVEHAGSRRFALTSAKGTVRFESYIVPEGQWIHVAIAHQKPRLTASQAYLYIDGALMEQVKCSYIGHPLATQTVRLVLGENHRFAQRSTASWELGPTYFILEEVLPKEAVAAIHALGVLYDANFQGDLTRYLTCEKIAWAPRPATGTLGRRDSGQRGELERRGSLSERGRIATARSFRDLLLASDRIYFAFCARNALEHLVGSAQGEYVTSGSTVISRLLAPATHGILNAALPRAALPLDGSSAAAKVARFPLANAEVSSAELTLPSSLLATARGNLLVSVPQRAVDALYCLGGCGVLLGLLDRAASPQQLAQGLQILAQALANNWRLQADMESQYDLLAHVLARKNELLGPAACAALVDLCCNNCLADDGASSAEKMTQTIVNLKAFAALFIQPHLRLWPQEPPERQHGFLATLQRLLAPENSAAAHNARVLARLGLVETLLHALRAQRIPVNHLPAICDILERLLPVDETQNWRTLFLFLVATLPNGSQKCDPEPANPACAQVAQIPEPETFVVCVRNAFLRLALDRVTTDGADAVAGLLRAVPARVLLLFLQARVHVSTAALAMRLAVETIFGAPAGYWTPSALAALQHVTAAWYSCAPVFWSLASAVFGVKLPCPLGYRLGGKFAAQSSLSATELCDPVFAATELLALLVRPGASSTVGLPGVSAELTQSALVAMYSRGISDLRHGNPAAVEAAPLLRTILTFFRESCATSPDFRRSWLQTGVFLDFVALLHDSWPTRLSNDSDGQRPDGQSEAQDALPAAENPFASVPPLDRAALASFDPHADKPLPPPPVDGSLSSLGSSSSSMTSLASGASRHVVPARRGSAVAEGQGDVDDSEGHVFLGAASDEPVPAALSNTSEPAATSESKPDSVEPPEAYGSSLAQISDWMVETCVGATWHPELLPGDVPGSLVVDQIVHGSSPHSLRIDHRLFQATMLLKVGTALVAAMRRDLQQSHVNMSKAGLLAVTKFAEKLALANLDGSMDPEMAVQAYGLVKQLVLLLGVRTELVSSLLGGAATGSDARTTVRDWVVPLLYASLHQIHLSLAVTVADARQASLTGKAALWAESPATLLSWYMEELWFLFPAASGPPVDVLKEAFGGDVGPLWPVPFDAVSDASAVRGLASLLCRFFYWPATESPRAAALKCWTGLVRAREPTVTAIFRSARRGEGDDPVHLGEMLSQASSPDQPADMFNYWLDSVQKPLCGVLTDQVGVAWRASRQRDRAAAQAAAVTQQQGLVVLQRRHLEHRRSAHALTRGLLRQMSQWRQRAQAVELRRFQSVTVDMDALMRTLESDWARVGVELLRLGVFAADGPAAPTMRWQLDFSESRYRMRLKLRPLPLAYSPAYLNRAQKQKGHAPTALDPPNTAPPPPFGFGLEAPDTAQRKNTPWHLLELPAWESDGQAEAVDGSIPSLASSGSRRSSTDSNTRRKSATATSGERTTEASARLQRQLEPGDAVADVFNVTRIAGLDVTDALLLLGTSHLYLADGYHALNGELGNVMPIDVVPESERDVYTVLMSAYARPTDASAGARRVGTLRRWSMEQVREVHKRLFLLRNVALEFFFGDGRSELVTFHNVRARDAAYNRLQSRLAPAAGDTAVTGVRAGRRGLVAALFGGSPLQELTDRWCRRELSNFQYLMGLNTLAGRSYNDLTQYPVFPWVVRDFESAQLDLLNPETFRNLALPMGAQTPRRSQQFRERFDTWDDPQLPACHYGVHYSSAMIVCSYLIRLEPFTAQFVKLQGGHFDHPDRLFQSIQAAWRSASEQNTNDVRELIPEFFYQPEFLANRGGLNLGTLQSGARVDHVHLPPWARNDPRLFVELHRRALESEHVSEHLHEWIDLVFGCKQQGDDAKRALNCFHYMSYEGAVDMDAISDPVQRQATVGIISNFGQCPRQLFRKAHPHRGPNPLAGAYRLHTHAQYLLPSGAPLRAPTVSDPVFFRSDTAPSAVSDLVLVGGGSTGEKARLVVFCGCRSRVPPAAPHGPVTLVAEWGFLDTSLRLFPADAGAADPPLFVFEKLHVGQISRAQFVDDTLVVTVGSDQLVCVWRLVKPASAFGTSGEDAGASGSGQGATVGSARADRSGDSAGGAKTALPPLVPAKSTFEAPLDGLGDSGGAPESPAGRSGPRTGNAGAGKRRQLVLCAAMRGHRARITALAASRLINIAVTGDQSGAVHVWDLCQYRFVWSLDHALEGPVSAVAINDTLGTVAVGVATGLGLWSANGDPLATWSLPTSGPTDEVTTVAFHDARFGDGIEDLVGVGTRRGLVHLLLREPSQDVDGPVFTLRALAVLEPAQRDICGAITSLLLPNTPRIVIAGDSRGQVLAWTFPDGGGSELHHVSSDACAACASRFAVLERRQHCRCCGRSFCANCLVGLSGVSGGAASDVRVCGGCCARTQAVSAAVT